MQDAQWSPHFIYKMKRGLRDPSERFWVNYTKRVVQYLILLAGEVRSGVLAAARKAQPRGLVALYQQWLENHEWIQFVFVIPPEVLSVGVILDLLPSTSECNEVKFKWEFPETQLTKQEGRIPVILDPDFSYTKMRKRKIFVISDAHAGTYDPDPKTGEPMYTSIADHMKKTDKYDDIVDFGDSRLEFNAVAARIRKFRESVLKQEEKGCT